MSKVKLSEREQALQRIRTRLRLLLKPERQKAKKELEALATPNCNGELVAPLNRVLDLMPYAWIDEESAD